MTREEKMTDLIQMYSYFAQFSNEKSKCHCEALQMAIEALQEQKTGKWIIFPPCFEEICMCSNCKTKFKEAYQHRDTCPSCGANMEV